MKKALLVILVFVAIIWIYLNRSYACIFNPISDADLKSPDRMSVYLINGDMPKDKNLVYVALGDSLTAGIGTDNYEQSFPYLLAEKLAGDNTKITLKDRAFPGFETKDISDNLIALTALDNPDIITLFIGVNDVRSNVSEEKFRDNYERILSDLSGRTNAKIYAINIPFLDKLIFPPYNYYFDFRTEKFNKIIKELAQKYNTGYIDLYTQTLAEFKKLNSYYSPDSFHPSAKGYAFWAQIIYDGINK